ncbi:MAG: hypothetical protein ACUVWN_15810 [bacterium]
MRKVILYYILILLAMGCEDSSDEVITTIEEVKTGLSGNTYLNTVYGIRISNLPVESWTIKTLGNDMKGLKMQSEQEFLQFYYLLLMEPLPENEYIGPNKDGYLDPVVDAGIPFIVLAVNYQKGINFETYGVSKEIDRYAKLYSLQIEPRKPVYVGNSAGIQAILYDNVFSLKGAITWFAKNELLIRYDFYAKDSDFDNYIATYDQIIKDTWFIGK